MIFGIIVLAIIGIVGFFHYVQGFFSATLSAVITVIAAVLAVSYHEQVVEAGLGGKAAKIAHGMTLAGVVGGDCPLLPGLFGKVGPGHGPVPALLAQAGGGGVA